MVSVPTAALTAGDPPPTTQTNLRVRSRCYPPATPIPAVCGPNGSITCWGDNTYGQADAPAVDVATPETDDAASNQDAGVHQPAIDALRKQVPGIFDRTGCEPQGLCPNEPLQRWEMAVWLTRILGWRNPTNPVSTQFGDVPDDTWWAPHVHRLAKLGVTKGCTTQPLRFCPHQSVTRAQMATFLTRAFSLDPASAAGFADTEGTTHEANIDALAAAGITVGCKTDPPRFCPHQSVTRAQMATFLARALSLI